MTSKLMRGIAIVLLMMWAGTLAIAAQDYKALLGKWQMTSETNGDPVSWTLVLKDVDGKVGAFLTSEDGEQPAKDVTYAGGVLKFKTQYQGGDYDIELKLTADKLEGKWSGEGDSGRTSGTRI
ncbi:MAG TPA: hypothetical protein VH351_01420 [Bryobacteraceae bacterium]|jgi:hypothetical protein|nr:hypothetical protein [Bryobacteraceae bacterium]